MAARVTPHGYPSEYFHCLLDEQPYYLAPTRHFGQPESGGALMINPQCWFTWLGPLPPDKASRIMFAEYLYPGEWMVWVDDPGTRAVWPYWVGPEYAQYLHTERPGYLLSRELPPHAVWVLKLAGILVEVGFPERRRKAWLDTVKEKATQFARGYTSVDGLLPSFQVGALRRYYRHHVRAGSYTLGDEQVRLRHVAHNDGVAAFFHCQLTHAVTDIAGTIVRPSYSYLAAYESGASLDRHTDREQCEYSITMCIDATPEPDHQAPWPIQLDVADGALRIWQNIGEGLVYRGRYVPHYRDPLPEGNTSTSLLFHYVDYGFTGSLT
jgi:hypothetical protein